jgi:hypothetical protein
MFSNPFRRREIEFNQLPQEDRESLNSNRSTSEKLQQLPYRTLSLTQVALLLIATLVIAGLSGASISAYYLTNFDKFALKRVSKYCRLHLEDVMQ